MCKGLVSLSHAYTRKRERHVKFNALTFPPRFLQRKRKCCVLPFFSFVFGSTKLLQPVITWCRGVETEGNHAGVSEPDRSTGSESDRSTGGTPFAHRDEKLNDVGSKKKQIRKLLADVPSENLPWALLM